MDIFNLTAELSSQGRPFMLATVVRSSGSSPAKPGFRMIVESSGSTSGTIGGGAIEKQIIDEATEVLSSAAIAPKPVTKIVDLESIGMECGGRVELLIEYFLGRKGFVLFGGGHVGQALSPILELLGYQLTIFDNRPEVQSFIAAEKRNVIIQDYTDISTAIPSLNTAGGCFIATHGHEWDQIILSQVIKTAPNLPYIGMIGSKKKVKLTLDNITSEGLIIPENLYSPVGLKIGGDTAAEIAVSIAAEIIAVNNRVKSVHMR